MADTLPRRHATPTDTAPEPPAGTAPSPPANAAGGGRGKQRDAFFDNVKFLTAMLVVVGHVWAEFGDSNAVRGAYVVVYGFHMPLFVFLTGFFSRGYMKSADKFRNLIPQLIVPYVIFIVLYRMQLVAVKGVDFNLHQLFRPHFLMWFLVAMVLWRVSAPLWRYVRYPVAASVALSLVAGSWAFTADATLSRTAGLLPFFVLGLVIDPAKLNVLRRNAARWIGAVVLLGALAGAYFFGREFLGHKVDMRFLWWNEGYEAMHRSALTGMAGRSLALLLAVVLGAAFLAVTPRGRMWFTDLGTRTMYVYLLHGLVVKMFDYNNVFKRDELHTPGGIVLVTLAALALGVLLATAPIRQVTRWAVEPRVRWLLRTPDDEAPGARNGSPMENRPKHRTSRR